MTGNRWCLIGLLGALMIAGLLSPGASRWPDGLDWAAERLGFQDRTRRHPLVAAPLADYKLPWVHDTAWSTAAAGVTGTLVVFGGACLLGFALTRRRSG